MVAILDLLFTETSNQNKNVTIVLSMVEYPHLDILHGHSNRFIWHGLICPNSLNIGPLGPYVGPNDPRGGIFALGNMCFHKPGSDRDLWVPLKFCHQGGARGPLLPTRLNCACTLDWCHLPGDDDASIMRCCLKASISVTHRPSQRNWWIVQFYGIPMPEQVGIFFLGFAWLMKVSHCSRGSSLVIAMTWRTARARILNVKSPM